MGGFCFKTALSLSVAAQTVGLFGADEWRGLAGDVPIQQILWKYTEKKPSESPVAAAPRVLSELTFF